jgi:hypothetical protein
VVRQSSPRGGGGNCGGGGFDSGVVDGELQHRRRQEAVGSSGGFMCGPVGEEKARGGKGGNGGRSAPFEAGEAARAIGEGGGVRLGVPHGGREGGGVFRSTDRVLDRQGRVTHG